MAPNWSPSLNLSHYLTDKVTLKAGVARATRRPICTRRNPTTCSTAVALLLGRGCGPCYLMGNADLKPETSINKELGIEYADEGLLAGVTLFHNDYRNKIDAGMTPVGTATGGTGAYANADVFTWTNIPKAVVSGVEGTFNVKLSPAVRLSNNLTYMVQSKNRPPASSCPSSPSTRSIHAWSGRPPTPCNCSARFTWYGGQKPNKLDYQGLPLTGEETRRLAPYALVGVGARYSFSKDVTLTAGIKNLFDKRLYRMGNAVGVNNPRTIYGAGAATYNEPGRSFYASLTAKF
ncbi:TonB-dependent receptor domain-containing protein [Comamonas sp. JC664]|uniref:TonB-dependent receptor domain-containing protein n=1 Tax=Comamonas sp. JC664 TaxID=2801917 RepID=UPI00360FF6E2